jgi:hypothetical protein
MSLTRPTYLVELLAAPDDDAGTVHTVRIMLGDQLRAELEAGRNMVDIQAQPFALTGLWCWAALVRMGVTDLPWQRFKDLAVIAKAPETTAGDDASDPTHPAPGTSSP